MAHSVSRRDFARLFAVGGSAALFADPAFARLMPKAVPLPSGGASLGEAFWTDVRDQFVMPPDLAVINAANLCPASRPALEALSAETGNIDRDPSQQNRAKYSGTKEDTRKKLAAFLRVTPDEIVITRNTSESNNLVSNGLDLKAGDEVVIFSDNHPCNNTAWQEKSKRFGYTVKTVAQVNPHPGADYYIDAFTKALTPRTKVLALTHLTSTVGDLMPIAELCRVAREHNVLSLVDGAQSFGLLDVDLSVLQPDFYSGSAHKWPCSAREAGALFINKRSQDRIWPSIYSAYPGAVGISKTFEGFGQRDDATHVALGAAIDFQMRVGRKEIEQRSRGLAQQLMKDLQKIDGVKLWTSPVPERSAAVVSFVPGTLDANKLAMALYQRDRVGITTRGGTDRPGIRVSPHFYNSPEEIDRLVAALKRYIKSGIV
jgi:selenocysteine lyase/cysteine desulfurase